MNKNSKILWPAAIALSQFFMMGSANANVITALNSNFGMGPDSVVTCNGDANNGACVGFLGEPSVFDDAEATNYPFAGNEAEELALLNDLLANSADPSAVPVEGVNKTDMPGNSFSTELEYFSIKKGQFIWYFKNTSDVELDIFWSGDSFSHWTEYGKPPTDVPEPGSLPLIGLGLAGILLTRMKKRH